MQKSKTISSTTTTTTPTTKTKSSEKKSSSTKRDQSQHDAASSSSNTGDVTSGSLLKDSVDKVVLPGDLLGRIEGRTRIGVGLLQSEKQVMATKGGALREQQQHFWIESIQKRVSEFV
jgi:hypothetical protein